MKIGMLRIPVKDLRQAENFYSEKLGFYKVFGSVEDGFVGYALENLQVMIEPEAKGEFESGNFLGFSLYVDDINYYYSLFSERGVKFSGPPEAQFWGGSMTHLYDCSGNSFSLVEMMTQENAHHL